MKLIAAIIASCLALCVSARSPALLRGGVLLEPVDPECPRMGAFCLAYTSTGLVCTTDSFRTSSQVINGTVTDMSLLYTGAGIVSTYDGVYTRLPGMWSHWKLSMPTPDDYEHMTRVMINPESPAKMGATAVRWRGDPSAQTYVTGHSEKWVPHGWAAPWAVSRSSRVLAGSEMVAWLDFIRKHTECAEDTECHIKHRISLTALSSKTHEFIIKDLELPDLSGMRLLETHNLRTLAMSAGVDHDLEGDAAVVLGWTADPEKDDEACGSDCDSDSDSDSDSDVECARAEAVIAYADSGKDEVDWEIVRPRIALTNGAHGAWRVVRDMDVAPSPIRDMTGHLILAVGEDTNGRAILAGADSPFATHWCEIDLFEDPTSIKLHSVAATSEGAICAVGTDTTEHLDGDRMQVFCGHIHGGKLKPVLTEQVQALRWRAPILRALN